MSFITQYLPRRLLSRFIGDLARIPWPFGLNTLLLRAFAFVYDINLQEAEKSLSEYPTLVDFFIRRLKPGVRPIAQEFRVVHPCDSEIVQHGPIEANRLIQAKGLYYEIDGLTNDPQILERFDSGYFLTYYLCPTDYHRVHSPVEGLITQALYTEGDLWPVNSWSTRTIKNLYCKNERVFVEIATERGPVGLVFVGATNVGSIVLNFDSSIRTNARRGPLRKTYVPPLDIKKGEELGHFRLGSTVVALYSQEYAQEIQKLKFNRRFVKMGQGFLR